MPETITLSKRNPSSRPVAVARVDNNTRLPRCVQRRLLCPPLSVRCHPRPTPYRCVVDHRTPANTTYRRLPIGLSMTTNRSVKSTSKNRVDRCPPGFLVSIGTTPRCKKSLSMMDLSAADPEIGDVKSESSGSSAGPRPEEIAERSKDILSANGGSVVYCGSWTDTVPSSGSERSVVSASSSSVDPTVKAASVVCHMLVLNAWRRRRAEIAQLEQQVEHLHLQIEFLRRLLIAENERVGRLNGELRREKSQLEEVTRERDAVNLDKKKLETELKRVEDAVQERSVAMGNLKNELLTTRDQLKACDAQMAKDREKLLKLREDKKILLDKVSASEALATERGARAGKAESAVVELKLRLEAQTALAESAREQLQRASKDLEATETERKKLEISLRASEDLRDAANFRLISLENKLADREAELRCMELEYNSQIMELTELRDRLVRQSQEGCWSNRILQIAGSIMRASIWRTFMFLSNAAMLLPP
ncbi:uncharacterized protein LOC109856745 [Pseudomyrmex gracilis]|uniref:uncharacterized protein LOC109856745 n=1 Tax=Pseudomyrmex gracilis TaxID=219809 RepID=UPI0009951D33|nr:uncharacterized protein LOC109856745 [Pseudomyrmex gracilis]